MNPNFDGEVYRVPGGPPLFDISLGAQKEVDIRRGLQRALDFVAWGHVKGLLKKNLLVIGSGPVGIAAALAAARLGVTVGLSGYADRFGRVATSPRWVHPHLYLDWPSRGSDVEAVQGLDRDWSPEAPIRELQPLCNSLSWRGSPASSVVKQWRTSLREHFSDNVCPIYENVYSSNTNAPAGSFIRSSGTSWELVRISSSSSMWGLALVCIGPGKEFTALEAHPDRAGPGQHPSFPYWSVDDPLWGPTATVPTGGEVLVLGAGDGGQQDLFRVLTGKDPVAVVVGMNREPVFLELTQAVRELHTSLPARGLWRSPLKTMLLKQSALCSAWQGLLHRHAPVRTDIPGLTDRTKLVSRGNPDSVEAFALNHFLTLGLEFLAERSLAVPGTARDYTSPPQPPHHSPKDCLDTPHHIKVDDIDYQDVRRFIVRIGQEYPFPFGRPRCHPKP